MTTSGSMKDIEQKLRDSGISQATIDKMKDLGESLTDDAVKEVIGIKRSRMKFFKSKRFWVVIGLTLVAGLIGVNTFIFVKGRVDQLNRNNFNRGFDSAILNVINSIEKNQQVTISTKDKSYILVQKQ